MRGLASGKPFGRASWHAGRVIAARLKNDLRHQRAGNIRVRAVQVPTGGTTTAMSIGGDHAENDCLNRGGRSSVAALSSQATPTSVGCGWLNSVSSFQRFAAPLQAIRLDSARASAGGPEVTAVFTIY